LGGHFRIDLGETFMANGSKRAAQAMLGSARNLGNLTGATTYSQQGTVDGTDRLFKFKLARSGSINIFLEKLSSNADLRLLSEGGRELKRSTRADQRSESIQSRLNAGSYYVQVLSGGGSVSYQLGIAGEGRALDAGNNVGNALDTGILTGANRSCEGRVSRRDQDFYRFDVTERGTVDLSLGNMRRDIDLNLLDRSGNEIATSKNNDASDELISQTLNAGTYFVQVSRSGKLRTSYKLRMSGDGTVGTGGSGGGIVDLPSGGGALAGAESVSSATFSRSDLVGGSDREDTYRFSLSKSGVFSADITGLAGNSSVKLVQDSNNNGVIDTDEVLSSNKTVRRFLNSGTYFLQVASDNPSSLSYSLKTNVTEISSAGTAIRVTNTKRANANGLSELQVSLVRNGRLIDSIAGVSGQPTKQSFRTAEISKSGSAEPLPEGYWQLGNVEWASGIKGDESKSWADPPYDGVGPAWVGMSPLYQTERSAIGFHLDNNAYLYPGTVGCIGLLSKSDLRKFVGWFDNSDAPKVAIVDWGLGTVEV
jgi:Bacterial pre-peptidase C-terminal domain